jgi:hypothetical protein
MYKLVLKKKLAEESYIQHFNKKKEYLAMMCQCFLLRLETGTICVIGTRDNTG